MKPNWKVLWEKYPKTWSSLLEFDRSNEIISSVNLFSTAITPLLFTFFDKNDLFIEITIGEKVGQWEFTIYKPNGDDMLAFQCSGGYMDSREDAEVRSFIRAFRLLERKIKNQRQ